ncbi:AAA family ATPase [Erwinia sp. JUb26]|uniref:AAA family ATPase n=1 Tax=Erwinia sp. JUb26 TaxID=2485126 RepID=UPI000F460B0E|nr:AAA family ATPase [Erwinia sp. JUb26]ROR10141.1 AAA ATPase-like protein [Erwinia sp. JUb26]
MKINIEISKIQHVEHMSFAIDLSENKLTCIVGKNGTGKTTLIKAIKNLQSADTFIKTSSRYIFNSESRIVYNINDEDIIYAYDDKLKVIDTKQIIPSDIKSNLYVELPIPHGMRFNNFPTLSKIDTELRKSIAFESYSVPYDLISIFNVVYQSSSYNNFKSFSVKNETYYFRLNDNGTYIREDYFSSGEYFILNLFRMIELKRKFIVIDEIDISLDSSAQVHLIDVLRKYCQRHSVNIVFTTHSLALMQTMNDDELYYMCENDAGTSIINRSYNFIKSTLFGFKGWDKYILTEDKVLQDFLEYIIDASENEYFYEYKIIYVGGGTNVIDLMRRNEDETFLTTQQNVISVLDGDQLGLRHARGDNILCIPFQSVEKDFYQAYENDESIPRVTVRGNDKLDKQVYRGVVKTYNNGWDETRIFKYLETLKPDECETFRQQIRAFLQRNIVAGG